MSKARSTRRCCRCRKVKPRTAYYVRASGPCAGELVVPCRKCQSLMRRKYTEPVDDLPSGSPDVEYRLVPGSPLYAVGSDGSVWSRAPRSRSPAKHYPWRKLKPDPDRNGYFRVYLADRRGKKARCAQKVYQLVMAAFVGPAPKGMVVRHFPDRNPRNDALSNLSYGTQQQNIDDQLAHGTRLFGTKNPACKLSDVQVDEIRKLLAEGKLFQYEIARMFGISRNHVSSLKTGHRRKERR